MKRHFMLLPSLACQANCSYCFGPNRGPVMPREVFAAAMDWIAGYSKPNEAIEITFHGGEPLLAGKDWYRLSLSALRHRFDGRVQLGIQSNLWLLDDEYCSLFQEYKVAVGTSLDGPEPINDAQRGQGYFMRTMTGIEAARRNGLNPGVICTFTQKSARTYREVFEFFADRGLSFTVHEAVCTLGQATEVDPAQLEETAGSMVDLFNYYVDNINRIQISTFDSMARGLFSQKGGLCTFGDCLGKYLTVGPSGGIFSCNRFAHHPEWQIGSVFDLPGEQKLASSSVWQKLLEREHIVKTDCGDCPHYAYCRGGCPYNAFTSGTGLRDPHCVVYRRLFDQISTRALEEVFAPDNMEAVITHGTGKHGLMRKGRLLQVMKDGLHPKDAVWKARETVAAVALACSSSPEEAVEKLDQAGIITNRNVALGSVRSLRNRLDRQSKQGLLNAYFHVTYTCPLSCSHCYARSSPEESPFMKIDEVQRLAHEAVAAGFTKIIITGGEPMVHPQRNELLDTLNKVRAEIKSAQIVLRTNLAYPLSSAMAKKMAEGVDQIVVSIDGDEASHNERRGAGSYAITRENLERLMGIIPASKMLINAVLNSDQINGPPGRSVAELGKTLGVHVRFKSILPIGRALSMNLVPSYYNSIDEKTELLETGLGPTATCGLGMNLYIGPRGECFPCYALMGDSDGLGNALADGMKVILERNDAYRLITVDSNATCRACMLRYLCGGHCRAWSLNGNPNAQSCGCASLETRAHNILLGALELLNISNAQWKKAGLPTTMER